MLIKKSILILACIFSVSFYGQTNVKAMFYNLLNYGADAESRTRTPHLKTVLGEVKPDLFMVCELKDAMGSDYLFNNVVLLSNKNFSVAPYLDAKSGGNLQQMVYYNKAKLVLKNSNAIDAGTRDINHYTFHLNTTNITTSPIVLEVFVTHLKASSGYSNRQKRLVGINNFVQELDKLSKDSFVLFSGDFNFYTSNEEGYQKLIDTNNSINIIDPINSLCPVFPNDGIDYFDFNNYNNTYFWNNSSFKNVHTQSTRAFAGTDGAGGGMDDRFDFIMMSKNFTTSSKLSYKTGSYKAVGNNGNCYNSSVNDVNCTGTYSINLRNALFDFSDHLPVVMEIETPENVLSTERIIQPISLISKNVVNNTLEIEITETVKIENLVIYNNLGQVIKNINLQKLRRITIDTSQFSKGLYYLKADTYKPIKFIKI